MKLYAIRHGETKMNAKNLINSQLEDELTEKGKEQAKIAGNIIPSSVARIYASPLLRTRQTAELINETVHLPLTFHEELKEVNFGILSGTDYSGEAKIHHLAMDYDWRPSGENVDDVKSRVLSILERIKQENGDGQALVVAHGGIIRMLHFLEATDVPSYIENTSITEFDLDKILA